MMETPLKICGISRKYNLKDNLARAIEHESSGNSATAYGYCQKAIDISPEIAHELIQVLNHDCISYIVASYEADAHMANLATTLHSALRSLTLLHLVVRSKGRSQMEKNRTCLLKKYMCRRPTHCHHKR